MVAGVLTYANALGHPFLFDDSAAIVDNPTIRALWPSLRGGPAQMPTAGRPLVNLTFALNYLAGGLAPWGYHAVNLAVHIGCALLLFALLRRVLALPRLATIVSGQETGLAAATALLFLVHPLTSEVVNYATERTEGLMALALLATLYAGVRAVSARRSAWWHLGSVTACAAGMACKESMVTAPVLMLLLDATFISDGLFVAVRRRRLYYAGLFATWLLLAVLIIEGPRSNSAGFSSGVSPWNYLLNQGPLIVHYLRLVAWPTSLVLDYGEPAPQALAAVWPAAGVVLILLVATVAAWRRAPFLAFLGTWFFLTLAPTSSFVPIATEVGAERRMYLPLVAVLTLVVVGIAKVLERRSAGTTGTNIARMSVAAACVVLSLLTMGRNREYATGLQIWQTVVDRHPSGRAHYNLGLELKSVGRRDDAIGEYRRALDTSPDAHYALGFELGADGRHEEAIEHYRTFIRQKPRDANVPRAYHQIGRALTAVGRHEEAATAFRDVLARKPGDADALGGLGDTLLAMERWADAVAAYAEFLRLRPADPDARFNLGLALVRLDRDAEARDAFASVVQLQPNNVAARVNLAYALANTGRYGDAVKEFRRAAELERDPAARAGIEQAEAQLLGNH